MEIKEYSEKIKNELYIEQVYELLLALGADPALHGNLITARTICHGGESHKLYYYDNTKLFRCYTECSEIFDIYDLIIKFKKQSGEEFSLFQSLNFIIKYFGLPSFDGQENEAEGLEDWKILKNYEKKQEKEEPIIEMKTYDSSILKHLPEPRIENWEKEGITKEVMKHCCIKYDPIFHGIVIPHYDEDGNLVGIRERTLVKANEDNGKYKPAILNYKMYNHPLGFNLYNLNNSKNNIENIKKVIVFEGEKSCLLYESYFGINNDITVAVCGSSLTKYQIQILQDYNVEEIIIAFDKQFKEIGDKEWEGWTKKLKDINLKYGSMVQISFMFDKWNLLGYKMSPIDNGRDVFLELFKRRVSL